MATRAEQPYNHTRPKTLTIDGKKVGGHIILPIASCTTVRQLKNNSFQITFAFPNSFRPGDGVRLKLTGPKGASPKTAMSEAGLTALAHLLLRRPHQVTTVVCH